MGWWSQTCWHMMHLLGGVDWVWWWQVNRYTNECMHVWVYEWWSQTGRHMMHLKQDTNERINVWTVEGRNEGRLWSVIRGCVLKNGHPWIEKKWRNKLVWTPIFQVQWARVKYGPVKNGPVKYLIPVSWFPNNPTDVPCSNLENTSETTLVRPHCNEQWHCAIPHKAGLDPRTYVVRLVILISRYHLIYDAWGDL